jgi:hypothetical protein
LINRKLEELVKLGRLPLDAYIMPALSAKPGRADLDGLCLIAGENVDPESEFGKLP